MKRRRVGNLLGLAVLTATIERPMHPYEIATVLRARGKDRDMPIKWGSLYRVVQNLHTAGYLEVVGSGRDGARPERTVYRITAAGRDEVSDWVRELLSTADPEQRRFTAGLSVMGVLDPDEVVRLLEQRVELLQSQRDAARQELDEHQQWIPRLFLLEREYDLAGREAELAWVRGVLRALKDGSFPGLEQWRTYHRTGVVPPELATLATQDTASNESRPRPDGR